MMMFIITCIGFATIDEYYIFNETNETYTPINGTVVNEAIVDNVIPSAIQLGFTFLYGKIGIQRLRFHPMAGSA